MVRRRVPSRALRNPGVERKAARQRHDSAFVQSDTMTSPHETQTKRLRNGRRVLLGLAVVAASAFAIGCDDESTHPPRSDIDAGWTCDAQTGMARYGGTITNHSSKASFYMIDIAFRVEGETVAKRSASVDDVGPGATTRVESVASEVHDPKVTCHVTNVERFKA